MNPTQPSTTPPILDLDAELLDLEILVGGKAYKLRSRAELSILEARRFSALLREYGELTNIENDSDLDDESAEKIGDTLQKVAAALVVDPPPGGFLEQQCAAILGFWTEKHQEAEGPPTRQRKQPQDRLPPQKQLRRRASTGAK